MGQRVSTDDHIAIADQMARYCHAIDGGDAAGWAACFTEDGVFAGPVTPEPLQGRAALQAFAQATYDNSQQGKMRHFFGNFFADYGATKDVAEAKLYNYVTLWIDGGKNFCMAICDVTFVRNGDGWLVKRNAFTLLT